MEGKGKRKGWQGGKGIRKMGKEENRKVTGREKGIMKVIYGLPYSITIDMRPELVQKASLAHPEMKTPNG